MKLHDDIPTLVRVVADPAQRRLTLLWADRSWSVMDFAPIIREGGVFAALDSPDVFAQARIIDQGEAIGWPGDIEVDVDMLWAESVGDATSRQAVGT